MNLQWCQTNAPFKSFKLSVDVKDMDTVMGPTYWPSGVCVERWHNRNKRENGGAITPNESVNSGTIVNNN